MDDFIKNLPDAPIKPPQYSEPYSAMVLIPHTVATSWLRHNHRNRNPRRRACVDLARDMAAGNFDLNGDAIKFSRPVREGEIPNVPAGTVVLLDGQHRLTACEIAQTPFPSVVIFGLEPTAQETIDSGIKRTLSDVLRMDGEINAAILGALVKRAAAWESGDRRYHANYALTKSEARAFLAKHPELRRSAAIGARTHGEFKVVRQSVVSLTHWIFTRIDEGEAAWFFQRLGDGAEMAKDNPIMALRRRLIDERESKEYVPDWKQVVYYIRAWNALREGKTNFVLFAGVDKDTVPEPK